MLLIVSNSMDGTTDLLLPLLQGKKEVFRFNVDIWSKYEIKVNHSDFTIVDPIGRRITQDTCSGMYLRKPYFLDEDRHKPPGGDLESWCQYQIRSIIDGLYWICSQRGLVRLIERNAERRLPKVAQMRLAESFFHVPRWTVATNPMSCNLGESVICKPLASAYLGEYQTLFTTKCSVGELDPGYPWLIQDYIDADGDLTIVYAIGRLFPFFRRKIDGEPVDFKQVEHGQDKGWLLIEIPCDLECSINEFMSQLDLEFGRLDFLVKDDKYYFLEINCNGQFAWLDPGNSLGLLGWIADCISV